VEFLQADARSFQLTHKYHCRDLGLGQLETTSLSTKELAWSFVRLMQAAQRRIFLCSTMNTEAGYLYEWSGDFLYH